MSHPKFLSLVIALAASQAATAAVVPNSDHFNGQPRDFIVQGHGAGWGVANTDLADVFDTNLSVPSHMVIEAADGPGLNAWYGDEVGMAAVRRVVGPFRLTVPLRVMHKLGSDLALTNPYNAAGVYIGLNPTVYSPGGQSYVVYNVGFQESSIAREVKSTVPNPGGESLSSLYLNAHDGATPIEVELRACRIGPYFEFHWRPIGASDWNQEVRTFDTVRLGNGEDVLPPETDTGTPMVFYRPDLDLPTGPLYVGVMLNAWEYDGAEKQTRAEYEAVTYEGIQPGDSCVD